ncbi:MAG: hypothetical protein V4819_24445 [Verrucomicrobiota bacterium]
MKIGWQRILSMVFLIAALALFVTMHILPLSREDANGGWVLWIAIWELMHDPRLIGDSQVTMVVTSLLTCSLLIIASPFLGNVWVKSLLAWLIVLIFSGVATAGFWFMILKDSSVGSLSSGMWCLMISPVLNFAGLLLARPQWLEKSGPSFPPECQAVN